MKTGILLIAYGSANPEGKAELKNFESRCRELFPGFPLRWAFTSANLRGRLALQRQKSDSIAKALMRFHFEKFDTVAIQPLQIIPGREYEEALQSAASIGQQTGLVCRMGKPMLSDNGGLDKIARALLAHFPTAMAQEDQLIFMGHGARHPAGSLYAKLGEVLNELDPRAYVAAMSSQPRLDDILPRLTAKNIWLVPLLSVIGTHALRDMAGEGPESWKSRIEARGHTCCPVLRGMTQCQQLMQFWLDNLQSTLSGLEVNSGRKG